MAENNTEVTKVAINDIGTEEDFIKAVDSTIKNFDDGDLVEGTVVKIDHDEVLLDIGYKTEGVIPSRELSIKKDVDPDEVVEVGDTIEALVVTKEDKEGRLILSKKRAQYERAWGDIEKIKEADGVVEGTVIEAVKGGLIVDIGLRGFLPASLVEMRRVRDLSPYIGQKIKAKILELDKNRNNVVLSRRQYLEETQSEVRETFLSQLKKGQIREGVVSSIVNFGAFVDLGGVDGLIHVSELSWKHIGHPSEVVKVGDKVSNWNNLGVQLTSVFTMTNTPDLPDHEYVAVLVTAVNRSGATTFEIGAQNLAELDAAYPLDDEATKLDVARQYFHALAASTTDFTAVCDGAEAEVGAYIQLYDAAAQSFSESTNLPPQGTGYLQLMLMVPKGWQQLSVTYMPTFAADKTMTFVMTAADVTRA